MAEVSLLGFHDHSTQITAGRRSCSKRSRVKHPWPLIMQFQVLRSGDLQEGSLKRHLLPGHSSSQSGDLRAAWYRCHRMNEASIMDAWPRVLGPSYSMVQVMCTCASCCWASCCTSSPRSWLSSGYMPVRRFGGKTQCLVARHLPELLAGAEVKGEPVAEGCL